MLTIPSDAAAARQAFPWLGFEGRWGELQQAFFNGPTGPNLKTAVDEADHVVRGLAGAAATPCRPAACSGRARPTSSAAPSSKGSVALVRLLRSPTAVFVALVVVLALVLVARPPHELAPVAPLRLGRRRTWGQILSAAGRMYVERPLLFLGIGVILIPISIVIP